MTARVIGQVNRGQSGPMLICIAGQHGNEPTGVWALQRVFSRLEAAGVMLRGEVIGLAGNIEALRHSVRFVAEDLNRMWRADRMREIRSRHERHIGRQSDIGAEFREQIELLEAVESAISRATGPIHVIDLHTTSSSSVPFIVMDDALHNRNFALHFPVPIVLGLEEVLDGTLPDFVNSLGCITMGFEAGQHDAPSSIDRHEAAIWIALVAAGCLDPHDLPEYQAARTLLISAACEYPRFFELRHHHPVRQGDQFVMRPGYANFQRIRNDERLAHDRSGPIHAPTGNRILMPLYQPLGDDGFFVIREVSPFWLRCSAMLRHIKADRIAHWLPGVRRDSRRPGVLLVNPRIALWLVRPIFHLLGYRRRRPEGHLLVFSRRSEDFLHPPGGE